MIYRSYLRTATDDKDRNRRLDEPDDKDSKDPIVFIKSKSDDQGESSLRTMTGLSTDDLIGRTFLKDIGDQKIRGHISRKVIEKEENDPFTEEVRFIVNYEGKLADEILSYNEILTYLEKIMDEDDLNDPIFKFRDITAHQGPLTPKDPSYKGSKYNILVEWETGETTYEPLDAIAADDPVTCAAYAKRNGLLSLSGWKRFKRLAKRDKVMIRMLRQCRLKQANR